MRGTVRILDRKSYIAIKIEANGNQHYRLGWSIYLFFSFLLSLFLSVGYLLCNGLSFCDLVQVRSLSFIPFRFLLTLSLFSLLPAAYIGEIIRRGFFPLYKTFFIVFFIHFPLWLI